MQCLKLLGGPEVKSSWAHTHTDADISSSITQERSGGAVGKQKKRANSYPETSLGLISVLSRYEGEKDGKWQWETIWGQILGEKKLLRDREKVIFLFGCSNHCRALGYQLVTHWAPETRHFPDLALNWHLPEPSRLWLLNQQHPAEIFMWSQSWKFRILSDFLVRWIPWKDCEPLFHSSCVLLGKSLSLTAQLSFQHLK